VVEFDPNKDAANTRKHGISLSRFSDMTDRLVGPASGRSVGEPRWIVFGRIDDGVFAAVVTYRGENIRVISLRPASRKERTHYGEATKE
jgi:hypothetical protein